MSRTYPFSPKPEGPRGYSFAPTPEDQIDLRLYTLSPEARDTLNPEALDALTLSPPVEADMAACHPYC